MDELLLEAIIKTSFDFHNKYISPEATEDTVRIATEYATYIVLKFMDYYAEQQGTGSN